MKMHTVITSWPRKCCDLKKAKVMNGNGMHNNMNASIGSGESLVKERSWLCFVEEQ